METKNVKTENALNKNLQPYVSELHKNFDDIAADRKQLLTEVAGYISGKQVAGDTINLTFICTHNSRRSHMSQLWAQAAAHYYGVPNVYTYSGGTEATAFNPRAVRAMQQAGFSIEKSDSTDNPVYLVNYADAATPVKAFSKKYDDAFNPSSDFVAIMTCNQADEACPIVYGAEKRFSVTYEDPKVSDGTSREEQAYAERCRQIGQEMMFLFSQIKQ